MLFMRSRADCMDAARRYSDQWMNAEYRHNRMIACDGMRDGVDLRDSSECDQRSVCPV
jgi:hypothetical protein